MSDKSDADFFASCFDQLATAAGLPEMAEEGESRLTTLVAERDTINREWGVCASRMVAAEAEVARLNHENGKLEEEARALREALRGYMFGGSLDSLKAALGEDK